MFSKQKKILLIMLLIVSFSVICVGKVKKGISFADDFEKGLAKWDLINSNKIGIIDSGDPKHGKVLSLHPGGPAVYALIKGSDGWTNVRVEGDFFFPSWNNHYMGFIYNYNVTGPRTDFGSIFIYGPYGDDINPFFSTYQMLLTDPPDKFLGNVVLVNPHRDSNASRALYSEYWTVLRGDEAIKPGEWGHFKAEIAGPVCHFYVGDMNTPKITYDFLEYSSGRVGIKPRLTGGECWVDNITVTPIKELTYKGPILPAGITYKPEKLITKWDVIGPFSKRMKAIEAEGFIPAKTYSYDNIEYKWRPFETDPRGCVVAGRVCERYSAKYYAYFHAEINSETEKEVTLEFSSSNPLIAWLNNKQVGFVSMALLPWYDFWENPEHENQKFKVTLTPGKNHLMIYIRGGKYGGDGFFARCNMDEQK